MTSRTSSNLSSSPPAVKVPLGLSARKVGLLIFCISFFVRVVVVEHFGRPPVKDELWNDAVGWNLAQGHEFTASQSPPYVPGIFRSPGHPAFLAVVYAVAGHSYKAAYIAQSGVDASSAVLLFVTASYLLSSGAATLAGLLYAVYPYAAIFCGIMTQDTLLTFMVMLTLLCLVRGLKRPESIWLWVQVGVALGLTTLVKPFLILYFGVIVASLAATPLGWASRFRNMALVISLSSAVIIPWGVRDYVLFHAFPPLAVGSTGDNIQLLVDEIKYGDRAILARQAPPYATSSEQYLRNFVDGKALIVAESDKVHRYAPEVRKLWRPYLLLMAWHFPRLWVSTYAIFDRPWVGRAALALSFFVVVPGVIGMCLARRYWRELMPIYSTVILVTLIYTPYTLEARYTLPARPAMIFFVAVALAWTLGRIRGQKNIEIVSRSQSAGES